MRIAILDAILMFSTAYRKNQLLLIIVLSISMSSCISQIPKSETPTFNPERVFQDLEYQVDLGPRVIGSHAHEQVRSWLLSTSKDLGWEVEDQTLYYGGHEIQNIIAKREINDNYPWIILGAHYDSRIIADRDPLPENRTKPVPGANDGASGVSVLLELARILPDDLQANIWLVYFDAEDNGSMPGGEWILGSRAFVGSLQGKPDAVVILDMVGDEDLNIHIETNSDPNLAQEIWGIAELLGYENEFINLPKHRIIDDHLPFIQAGIPAVDIIDFDYPYWHTVADTTDKVSPKSLKIVGDVVQKWLIERYGVNP